MVRGRRRGISALRAADRSVIGRVVVDVWWSDAGPETLSGVAQRALLADGASRPCNREETKMQSSLPAPSTAQGPIAQDDSVFETSG